ncbi:type IV pilus assembly protein PilB [Pullulanibacillus pueri]|uniref:Type II secretion system protein E n=1 Tax=Pullulanibacillus pueri TaxID=1437324 RepID=A0A8J2ZYJ0_9BACL|nr:GspE/PulE family protein [Pullulanibacillus pueri]MBM7680510.1 type IV pilus assembly protein PilB [Pullulanibacillus pueri]GGH86070.1 type II secretion system protein E [Pullulanibacillus pueri]
MPRKHKRLGDLLIEAGVISEKQLQQTLEEKEANEKLGNALVKKGYLTEQQLLEVLELQLGIPLVNLYQYPLDPSLKSLISKDFARRNLLVPLRKQSSKLTVAMADPLDFYAIEDLRLSTGFTIETVIATNEDIMRTITRFYDASESIEDLMTETTQDTDAIMNYNVEDEDSPVVRIVNQILQNAIQQRASDIHIEPQETSIKVRYRIDGMLRVERVLPRDMLRMLTVRIKVMANLNITETRKPQDGRVKITMDHHAIDLRISILPTILGEKIVIRLLNIGDAVIDISRLGFSPENEKAFKKLIDHPTGIVLITGPTGSGKTSTLYAAINLLNKEESNLITIEDPVEYQIEGINQIQVNSRIGLTFADGLRAILRQDPNIIMVGEIRDTETANIAVRASLTGHLVLSTVHTNDSVSTITRLVDMGVEPFLVASSLTGVVSQRLVRRICRDCAESYAPRTMEKNIFYEHGMAVPEALHRGKGCGRCNMTGYRGRIAIHEILSIDDEIRRRIMDHQTTASIRDYAFSGGQGFLIHDGIRKVQQGITTVEEILRVSHRAVPQ